MAYYSIVLDLLISASHWHSINAPRPNINLLIGVVTSDHPRRTRSQNIEHLHQPPNRNKSRDESCAKNLGVVPIDTAPHIYHKRIGSNESNYDRGANIRRGGAIANRTKQKCNKSNDSKPHDSQSHKTNQSNEEKSMQ